MTVAPKLQPLDIDSVTCFGRAIEKFQDVALQQTENVFEQAGVLVPVRSCSLVLAIKTLDNPAATDLAQRLGYSHQLVLQKIPKLQKLGLIVATRDPDDARRRMFALTDLGQTQAELLETVLPAFTVAYEQLFAEIGDINALMARALSAIEARPLQERIQLPNRT